MGAYSFQSDPFATHMPEAYFNMARYLLQRLGKDDLEGVSRVYPFRISAALQRTLLLICYYYHP